MSRNILRFCGDYCSREDRESLQMIEESFNLDRFLFLSRNKLRKYTEPFVNTKMNAIPESVYQTLKSRLTELDEEHIVYSIEICMLLKPHDFVSKAVQFLAHSDAAVCCAAFRVIERLPASLINDDLMEKVRAIPIIELFTMDVLAGKKVLVGTNKEFINQLLAKSV